MSLDWVPICFYLFFCFLFLSADLGELRCEGSWGASLYLGCEFSMCKPHIQPDAFFFGFKFHLAALRFWPLA
jgi:hypothetical protein